MFSGVAAYTCKPHTWDFWIEEDRQIVGQELLVNEFRICQDMPSCNLRNGKSSVSTSKSSINGPLSKTMLNYQKVHDVLIKFGDQIPHGSTDQVWGCLTITHKIDTVLPRFSEILPDSRYWNLNHPWYDGTQWKMCMKLTVVILYFPHVRLSLLLQILYRSQLSASAGCCWSNLSLRVVCCDDWSNNHD